MTSPKERIESWNGVRRTFEDLRKRLRDRHPWHQDIVKRYKDGRLTVHVHMSVGRGIVCCECGVGMTDSTGGNSTLLKQRGEESVDVHHAVHVGLGDDSEGQEWQAMLVSVYEGVEPPKRLISGFRRLRVLDLGHRICGDMALLKTIDVIHIRGEGGIREQRERDRLTIPLCGHGGVEVMHGQLPSDVIQSGHAISEAITNDGAQPERGRWGDGGREVPRVAIMLFDNFVRLFVKVHPDFGLKRVNVFLSPDDFEPRSV